MYYKYGDNVDTDVIIPARYLNTVLTPQELASHAMVDIDPDFVKKVTTGRPHRGKIRTSAAVLPESMHRSA